MDLIDTSSKTPKDYINNQIDIEGVKDLDHLHPLDHGNLALAHTPIYKIHRYFARRPYSVFYELIKHYSNPGDIILDPFCGGGVTVIESLRNRRKVIGVDLNPLAIFVTEMEATDINLKKLDNIFQKIEKNIAKKIQKYYFTKCPNCNQLTPFHWMKWSYIYKCPICKKNVEIKDLNKRGSGNFICKYCKKSFQPIETKKIGEAPYEIEVRCNCNFKGIKKPDKNDLNLIEEINKNFKKIIIKNKLWYPKDEFPDADRQRDDAVFQKGVKYFSDLFTKRNLIALSILFKEIRKYIKTEEGKHPLLSFSDTLGWTSKMSSEPGHGWQHHAYWLPYTFYECNVWSYFQKRFNVMRTGKEYSKKEIGNFYKKANQLDDLRKNTCWLLTKSSHDLPISDGKVDVIITDPPYGGNVQYIELSLFYLIWLQKILKIDITKNAMLEAVETRHHGFSTEKSADHYRNMLFNISKECHRVLRSNGWMVMTFHNKNFRIWNTLHSVIHDAGFILPEEDGMIYQPPIMNYTQTLHTRVSGSMLGDFVLSFKRLEKPPKIKLVEDVEIGSKIRKVAAETIQYHGGAKLSTIYMRLVPFLVNNGLLHKIGENDITQYLKKEFEAKHGKWYFKETISEVEGIKPLDYIPVESRIEYLITSILHEKKKATFDEILGGIFTNLVNSNAAEYEEITRVLHRLAEQTNDRHWQLKERGSKAQTKLLDFHKDTEKSKEKKEGKKVQISLSGEEIVREESLHDLLIKQLIIFGNEQSYASHIGQTEQRKYVEFRRKSIPMGNNVQFGLNRQAFDIIREIDVLWLKEDTILAAFEVEKSTTIDSGINRFRNLFAATPNQIIPTYIIIPDSRENEAIKKIGSLANRKDNLHTRIKYLLFSDIKNKKDIRIEEQARSVI